MRVTRCFSTSAVCFLISLKFWISLNMYLRSKPVSPCISEISLMSLTVGLRSSEKAMWEAMCLGVIARGPILGVEMRELSAVSSETSLVMTRS